MFVALGLNVSAKDISGRTPLFYAVEPVHLEAVGLPLEAESDINEADTHGSTVADEAATRLPLHRAPDYRCRYHPRIREQEPLSITNAQQQYDASFVQCVGRARRYGQTKRLHVYRFIALQTIDVDIIRAFENKNPVLRSGVWQLVDSNKLTPEEEETVEDYSGGYEPTEN